jgi:hypothetical protein
MVAPSFPNWKAEGEHLWRHPLPLSELESGRRASSPDEEGRAGRFVAIHEQERAVDLERHRRPTRDARPIRMQVAAAATVPCSSIRSSSWR